MGRASPRNVKHKGHGAALAIALAASAITACGDDDPSASDEAAATSSASSSRASSTTASSTSTGGGGGGETGGGGEGGGGSAPVTLTAETTDATFHTADHMLAAIEMQLSGEPFAEALGRDLGGYDRFSATTDMYVDPATGGAVRDPLGFSLAVESYEYSKQPMNMLSFESSAGVALAYGPTQNPSGQTGDAAFTLLRDRVQLLAAESRASGAKFGRDFVTSPPPASDPTNPLGWPGFWPVFAEFTAFDPTIHPSVGDDHQCSLAGAIDEPTPPGTTPMYVADYECDANSLHLADRAQQITRTIAPDAMGFAAWKQGLWVINYWSSMHDVDQDPIIEVPAANLGAVGAGDNTVIGKWVDPTDPAGMNLVFGKAGTYLGDVSLEGFQGLVMLDELDNKAAALLRTFTTTDGAALSGFASGGAALAYDYAAPLRWWPAAIGVAEAALTDPAQPNKYFPAPTFSVADGSSSLNGLIGLLGGFATFYAMTDASNADVGGTQPLLATFDGSPYAADNGIADGESSPHDRALGVLKIAIVNADRLHRDDVLGALVDDATVAPDGTVNRGPHVSTHGTGYAIVALRQARRSLTSELTLYSNDAPDVHGLSTPLDATSLAGTPFSGTVDDRLEALIEEEASFLADHLVGADGVAAVGWDRVANAADARPATLAAQADAIRGLLDAYLATSDVRYRARAEEVFDAMEAHFWMSDARAYKTQIDDATTMTWTPVTFGALQGALRQFYKLVAARPGNEALAGVVLDRIGRTMKLVANGWDDRNGDGIVTPDECLGGRLQMAERALTGEFSLASDGGDRDHDCVPDIATAGRPAALANVVVITRSP